MRSAWIACFCGALIAVALSSCGNASDEGTQQILSGDDSIDQLRPGVDTLVLYKPSPELLASVSTANQISNLHIMGFDSPVAGNPLAGISQIRPKYLAIVGRTEFRDWHFSALRHLRLQKLRIDGSGHLTPRSLRYLDLRDLEELDLREATAMDDTLTDVLIGCPNLRLVKLRDSGVSEGAANKLRERFPDATILWGWEKWPEGESSSW